MTTDAQSAPIDGDDDLPLDAAAMAALIAAQEQRAVRDARGLTAWIYFAWGIAWTFGYSAAWSAETLGGNPWFRLSDDLANGIFTTLIICGVLASVILGSLSGRGMRGAQNTAGMMFGLSFAVASTSTVVVGIAIARLGLAPAETAVLFPALFALMIGGLYMAGAGIWRSWPQFILGAIFLAGAAVASLIGVPHHNLVYVVCGLLMLIMAGLIFSGVLSPDGSTERRRS